MPAVQQYIAEVEVRVRVVANGDVLVGEYSTRATFKRSSIGGGKPSDLIDQAVLKAASYSRAHAAAVDNNEAKRLK